MDARGDALFPRRYLDEFENRIAELHRCVERAREHAAEVLDQSVELLLDAAEAHEQAAMAYELAGSNGHAGEFAARAMRHRQAATTRRATAASMSPDGPGARGRGDLRLRADAGGAAPG